jgi:hypothetical protein
VIIPPPYQDVLQIESDVSLPWRTFFNEIHRVLNGKRTAFDPALTGFTDAGTASYSGNWWLVGRMFNFSVTLNSSGNMTSVAGTTFINNLSTAAVMNGQLSVFNSTTNSEIGAGLIKTGTKSAYLPAFGPTSDEIIVIGSYYV